MSKTDRHLEFYELLAKDVIAEHADDDSKLNGYLAAVSAKLLLDEVDRIREILNSERFMSPGDWMELGGSLDWFCAEIGKHIESPKEFAMWEKRMESHRQSKNSEGPHNRPSAAKEVLEYSAAKNWKEFVDFAGTEYYFDELEIEATALVSKDGEISRYDLYNHRNGVSSPLSPGSVPTLLSRIKKRRK